VIDAANVNAGGFETILDGFGWKSSAVFEAIESFFFNGSDNFSVTDDGRSRVPVIRIDT
jgi:hypothetical protein